MTPKSDKKDKEWVPLKKEIGEMKRFFNKIDYMK